MLQGRPVQGKVAWGVTGAGHLLPECVDLMRGVAAVDVFLSRAAEDVLRAYRLYEEVAAGGRQVYRDLSPSAAPAVRLYKGIYHLVVIAPATSNSVAKFVCGISDNLVTNLFAQAGKRRIPILVLPCDAEEQVVSRAPSGAPVEVYPRPVDLENVRLLREFPGVTVVTDVTQMRQELQRRGFIN